MPCGSPASTLEVVAAAGLTRVMPPARNRRDYDILAGAREKLELVWLDASTMQSLPRWRVE
jgi:ATP-dependent Lon protease